MKKLLMTAFFVLIQFAVFAQEPTGDNLITPETTELSQVYQSSVSLSQKHLNAKAWIAKNFGDYNSVVKMEDATAGKIIGKGLSQLEPIEQKTQSLVMRFSFNVKYTFTVDSKEDKFRIKIEDIVIDETIKCLNHNFPETRTSHDIAFYFSQIEANKGKEVAMRVLQNLELSFKTFFSNLSSAINKEDDF